MKITKPNRADMQADAMLGLIIGGPAMIQMQEQRGQKELCNADVLPTKMDKLCREVLTAAGVQFGDIVEGDSMFTNVILPQGWKKMPTDHYMWSQLVDANGLMRASVGYKAAHYDRWSSIHVVHRLECLPHQDEYDRNEPLIPCVRTSNGVILWRGTPMKTEFNPDGSEKYEKVGDDIISNYDRARAKGRILIDQLPLYKALEEEMAGLNKEDEQGRRGVQVKMCLAYFDLSDEDIKRLLPPSESSPPTGEKYGCNIAIYRDAAGRDYVDGGNETAITREKDSDAIAKFRKTAEYHARNYGSCRFVVRKGNETVHDELVVGARTQRPVSGMSRTR